MDLAEALRREGVTVVGQTRICAHLGLDKTAMKAFFLASNIPTPDSPRVNGRSARHSAWIVKRRFGTEGVGARLVVGDPPADLCDDEYTERYVEGMEYSVHAFSDAGRIVTLPVVHHGRNRTDLTPPHRRPRACPLTAPDPDLEEQMLEITRVIMAKSRCSGWIEAEFVVGADGAPLVLEINPRLAGTIKIAALAACVRVFDLPAFPGVSGHLPPRIEAIEVPWSGRTIVDDDRQIYATSRLAVGGPTRAHIEDKLRLAGLLTLIADRLP
jgi:predicted ATP-grasp superfamily ATP-dependent carboligase